MTGVWRGVWAGPVALQRDRPDCASVLIGSEGEGAPGDGRRGHRGQAFLIAETSNSRAILSLTRTPPVSSAAFQVMP
ncbi:hypothetical protein GCM10009623_20400 [Nocardioides aestuarii]